MQCEKITSNGTRYKRNSTSNHKVCGQHIVNKSRKRKRQTHYDEDFVVPDEHDSEMSEDIKEAQMQVVEQREASKKNKKLIRLNDKLEKAKRKLARADEALNRIKKQQMLFALYKLRKKKEQQTDITN
jgi:bifunctional N-acetylglucosamine-1-phosphate-uridyltransferase/glucosamine-1-phosphate-acetyltransferase GlmU-like protein